MITFTKKLQITPGIEFTDRNKKTIKSSCQHWLNIRKRYAHTGGWKDKFFNHIDTYFKDNFPTIYDELKNWREEQYTNTAGKTKISKMLWQDFQAVEYDLITNKMCCYLHEKYNVYPVTVHDALYLSDDDFDKVSETIEDIFWNLIDFKYLDYNPDIIADNILDDEETFISDFIKEYDAELEQEANEKQREKEARLKLQKIKLKQKQIDKQNKLNIKEFDKLF